MSKESLKNIKVIKLPNNLGLIGALNSVCLYNDNL